MKSAHFFPVRTDQTVVRALGLPHDLLTVPELVFVDPPVEPLVPLWLTMLWYSEFLTRISVLDTKKRGLEVDSHFVVVTEDVEAARLRPQEATVKDLIVFPALCRGTRKALFIIPCFQEA